MKYGRWYVSLSVLLCTALLFALATRGLALALERGWLIAALKGIFYALVVAAIVKLLAMCIFDKTNSGNVVKDWLFALGYWCRHGAVKLFFAFAVVIVFVCAAAAAFDVTCQLKSQAVIVSDFDAELEREVAAYRERAVQLADTLSEEEAHIEELSRAKVELELKIATLTSENVRLTETVKKAATTGALPEGFVLPPR